MANISVASGQGVHVQTLSDQVLNAVVLAVMERRIPFGARLKEAEIARDLNVSRMPVREALMRLVSEGVVTNTPFRGMCLMEVDERKLREILDVRVSLERLAFQAAIERLISGEETLNRVESALLEMERACSDGSAALMAHSDIGYHRSVVELSGNETLRNLWEMMARQFQMIVGIAWHVTDQQAIYQSHVDLHTAIAEMDQAKVHEMLAPHIMEAMSFGLGDLASGTNGATKT